MSNQHMEELNDQQIVRREKMAALAEQGIDPFGKRFERTATSGQLKEKYADKTKKFDKIIFCSKPFLTSIFLLLDFFMSAPAFNHLVNCTSYLLYQVYFLFLQTYKKMSS